MFLIFGWRTKAQRLGVVAMACRVCGRAGHLLLTREVTKLSLFFVPLVPVRTKHVLHCTSPFCGARTEVDAGEARRLSAAAVA